jgi:isopenicillin N synthase-like dioxygenase
VKSVVNRVAVQLAKALQNKGMALLVNHGISEEKVEFVGEFDVSVLIFTAFSVEIRVFTLG